MRLLVQIAYVFAAGMTIACEPLPRPKNFGGNLTVLPTSAEVTGLVLTSTDDSYTSSDIYFYNFSTGQLLPLATGESGDVLVKWEHNRLWVFNRASGRVSYSSFSPKVGAVSRSSERRTPLANAYDPYDFSVDHEFDAIFSMQVLNKVAVVNLGNGSAMRDDLGMVDTGTDQVPFRPGLIRKFQDNFLVFHQALDAQWQAVGAGRAFFGQRNLSGIWNWVDQNIMSPGIQGLLLHVSNPTAVFDCDGLSCAVAGACYSTSGLACIGGVDKLNWDDRSVVHALDWPSGFESVGGVAHGPKPGQVLACLKETGASNAKLVLMDYESGSLLATWDFDSSYCGDFEVDRNGDRIFVSKHSESGSSLILLNAQLVETSRIPLDVKISDIEAINE